MFKIKTYYIIMSEKYICNLLNRYKKEDINIGNNNTYFSRGSFGSINLYYFISNNNNLIPKNDKLIEYSKFYPKKIIVAKELEYTNNEEEDLIVNEIQINKILTSLSKSLNNNVIRMITFSKNNNIYNLYYNFISNNLSNYIKIMKYIDLKIIINIMTQIYNTIFKINSLNIVINDIKPNNILINGSNKIKIIDFGACRYLKNNQQYIINKKNIFKENLNKQFTICYVSPENILNKTDLKSDVWSVSMIFLEILISKPFIPIYVYLVDNYKNIDLILKIIDCDEYLNLEEPEFHRCIIRIHELVKDSKFFNIIIDRILDNLFKKKYSKYKKNLNEIKTIILNGLKPNIEERSDLIVLNVKIDRLILELNNKTNFNSLPNLFIK